MTFEQAFKRIKTKFANVDASKLQDMALQITFSDEDCGGTFYAAVRGGVLEVEPYDYRDNDAVIDASRAAIASVLDGKTSIEKEIEKGTFTVKGNLEKVAEFKDAIKAPVKKAAAKKPAQKKAEPKKTTAAKKSAPKSTAKKTETKAAKTDVKKTAAAKTEPVKTETKKAVEPKKAPAKAETKKAEPEKTSVKTEEKAAAVKETVKKETAKKPTDKKTK